MSQVSLATGSFDVTAQWASGTAPTWAALYPTQSREVIVKVKVDSDASHLRWKFNVSTNVASSFQAYVSTQVWLGNTCTGATVTGDIPTTPLSPGVEQNLCVKITLNANAPKSLAGTALNPKVIITAKQVTL